MSRTDDEDFLSRWSARKLEARTAPAAEDTGEDAEDGDSPPAAPPQTALGKTDAEILEELGLPDPDSLAKGDNFKPFLGAGVPARLRARALRRLWLSDPVLANLDGLNDYEQDFTDKATVLPDLKTAYRVGKGLLRDRPGSVFHQASHGVHPATPDPLTAADRAVDVESPQATAGAGETPIAKAGVPQEREPSGTAPAAAQPPAEDGAGPGPRMRFRFEEE